MKTTALAAALTFLFSGAQSLAQEPQKKETSGKKRQRQPDRKKKETSDPASPDRQAVKPATAANPPQAQAGTSKRQAPSRQSQDTAKRTARGERPRTYDDPFPVYADRTTGLYHKDMTCSKATPEMRQMSRSEARTQRYKECNGCPRR